LGFSRWGIPIHRDRDRAAYFRIAAQFRSSANETFGVRQLAAALFLISLHSRRSLAAKFPHPLFSSFEISNFEFEIAFLPRANFPRPPLPFLGTPMSSSALCL